MGTHTPTFYYTVARKHIRPNMPTMPVMISAASCVAVSRKETKRARLLAPRLPKNITEKAADCGGYVATHHWGGKYRFTPAQYVAWLDGWQPAWAITFDLCCVEKETKGSPGDNVVERRQLWTREMAELFFSTWPETPWAWSPVIQGFTLDQYKLHACLMAPLIHQMWAYYTMMIEMAEDEEERRQAELRLASFRVAVGSLVGRATPEFIGEVILTIQSIIGKFIALHVLGGSLGYFKALQQIEGVVSYDSSVYNDRFGRDLERQKGLSISQSQYLWQIAQPAYAKKIGRVIGAPQHLRLFPDPEPAQINLAGAYQRVLDTLADGVSAPGQRRALLAGKTSARCVRSASRFDACCFAHPIGHEACDGRLPGRATKRRGNLHGISHITGRARPGGGCVRCRSRAMASTGKARWTASVPVYDRR